MGGIPSGRILWINTGGTLVSEPYDDAYHPPVNVKPMPPRDSGQLVYNLLTHVNGNYAHGAHAMVDGFSYWPLGKPEGLGQFQKDSKQFTTTDLEHLARIIRNDHDHQKFLITHGTDRMAENAVTLGAMLKEMGVKNKKVIFTGAMLPLAMENKALDRGDAKHNIDFALQAIGELEPGVYIAARDASTMRMGCVDPERYIKDKDASLRDLQFTLAPR